MGEQKHGMPAAMKDAAQAATEVSNNFQQTQSYLSQVDNQLTDAKKLENSYQNISTPATVLKLKKQRLGFDNIWGNFKRQKSPRYGMLCGTDYGEPFCSRYTDTWKYLKACAKTRSRLRSLLFRRETSFFVCPGCSKQG